MRKTAFHLLAALGLVISPAYPQGMILNDDAQLFLPPAGVDFFPATKARFVVEINGAEQGVLCSGPTTIHRGDPKLTDVGTRGTAGSDGRNVIDTEIVALDLTCSGGVQVHLNPDFRSTGEINEQGDSFFDIFVEIDIPDSSSSATDVFGSMVLTNQEPARMQSTIGHIPPIGSVYFGVRPVALFHQGQPVGRLIHVEHDVNGVPKPETRGEFSTVFSCFYECKWEREAAGVKFNWREITTLMLVNQSAKQSVTAEILFVDGNENPIATAETVLGPMDLDEINVCASLDEGLGGQVPAAGVIEVVLAPTGGVYGWVKNVLGLLPRFEVEPFRGDPQSIAKTQCRLVGPNAVTPREIREKIRTNDVRNIKAILIEARRNRPPEPRPGHNRLLEWSPSCRSRA